MSNRPAPMAVRRGIPVLQRDATTWQLGIDPAYALVLHRVTSRTAHALRALDPERYPGADPGDLAGLAPALAAQLFDAGVLREAHVAHPQQVEMARYEPETLTAALHSLPSPLPRRRLAYVVVEGTSRAAALMATGLAGGGVGVVVVSGSRRDVRPADLTPAGPFPADLRRPWVEAVADAVRDLGATTGAGDRMPDVAVLTQVADADAPWCDPAHGDTWVGAGVPHLAVSVAGRSADVGAMAMLPGIGCLRCRALYRSDVDPAWSSALTLGLEGTHGPGADIATTALAAGLGLGRVLDYLDTGTAAGSGVLVRQGKTAEFTSYDVIPHPGCGCGWDLGADTMDP
jgi:hypothetical protein